MGERSKHRANLHSRVLDTTSRINDEIGFSTLVHIRHLPGQDHREFLFRHARTRQHTFLLDLWRATGYHNNIDAALCLRLEQQRNIQKRDRFAILLMLGDECVLLAANEWVDNALQDRN